MTLVRRSTREDSPMAAWIRANPEIESRTTGLAVTDIDWVFQKYFVPIDGLGSRELQCLLFVEQKCYEAVPSPSQLEQLFELHQLLDTKKKVNRPNGRPPAMLWSFGVYILSLPMVSPAQTVSCHWGQFDDKGGLLWRTISCADLPKILGFAMRPDTFDSMEDFRRHHALNAYITKEKMPLGFDVDTVVIKRS